MLMQAFVMSMIQSCHAFLLPVMVMMALVMIIVGSLYWMAFLLLVTWHTSVLEWWCLLLIIAHSVCQFIEKFCCFLCRHLLHYFWSFLQKLYLLPRWYLWGYHYGRTDLHLVNKLSCSLLLMFSKLLVNQQPCTVVLVRMMVMMILVLERFGNLFPTWAPSRRLGRMFSHNLGEFLHLVSGLSIVMGKFCKLGCDCLNVMLQDFQAAQTRLECLNF